MSYPLLMSPDLNESLIVQVPLGRDFPLGVIPSTNPTIIVAARHNDMAEHLAAIFEIGWELVGDNDCPVRVTVTPEDYLHQQVTPHLRAALDLPFIPAPKTVKGWHPYQRISQSLYKRPVTDKTPARRTTSVVHDGVPVFFAARPVYVPYGMKVARAA